LYERRFDDEAPGPISRRVRSVSGNQEDQLGDLGLMCEVDMNVFDGATWQTARTAKPVRKYGGCGQSGFHVMVY
jgi:hypothetical protein